MATRPDIVLWGVTTSGRRFRPSDWAERLAGLTFAFGLNARLAWSPLVEPMTIGAIPAVVVGGGLQQLEPRLYNFLLSFARDNELQTSEIPAGKSPLELTPPSMPRAGAEPREPV
jgi:hypothetical protein